MSSYDYGDEQDHSEAYKYWAEMNPEDDNARRLRRDKVITELIALRDATAEMNAQLDESLSTLAFIWEE